MIRIRTYVRVYVRGFRDGFASPYELSSGMSYEDDALDNTYDRGVNHGQFVRAPRTHERQP